MVWGASHFSEKLLVFAAVFNPRVLHLTASIGIKRRIVPGIHHAIALGTIRIGLAGRRTTGVTGTDGPGRTGNLAIPILTAVAMGVGPIQTHLIIRAVIIAHTLFFADSIITGSRFAIAPIITTIARSSVPGSNTYRWVSHAYIRTDISIGTTEALGITAETSLAGITPHIVTDHRYMGAIFIVLTARRTIFIIPVAYTGVHRGLPPLGQIVARLGDSRAEITVGAGIVLVVAIDVRLAAPTGNAKVIGVGTVAILPPLRWLYCFFVVAVVILVLRGIVLLSTTFTVLLRSIGFPILLVRHVTTGHQGDRHDQQDKICFATYK